MSSQSGKVTFGRSLPNKKKPQPSPYPPPESLPDQPAKQEPEEKIEPRQYLLTKGDLNTLQVEPLYSWKLSSRYVKIPKRRFERYRKKKGIIVEGEGIPAPVPLFSELRVPNAMLSFLNSKGISSPSAIQAQGLPVALSGRDLIGIAFTGSGKSLVFMIPAVCLAMECEARLKLERGEGPVSVILVPSRELARQLYDNINECVSYLREHDPSLPNIQTLLSIGGTSQRELFRNIDFKRGIHILIGTTGRTLDLMSKNLVSLTQCRQLIVDEADRMIDLGFDEEVRALLAHITLPHQTLLFSATMPKSIREFITTFLHNPIMVNVGRAGAASLAIMQDVVWVQDDRPSALFQALQKTPPPVLIFAALKSDVDDIHELLLKRHVEAAAIHGGLSQEERKFAIDAFKSSRKDVLVATDVASKGLDFKDIQHVINWEMPAEIEDYVHRIGRTGRGDKLGMATTFVSGRDPETILRDLAHLLKEAQQRIPDFLLPFLGEDGEGRRGEGCAVCGGLGHDASRCPKLDLRALKQKRGENASVM